jgi:uncharacterized protein (DUF433 family)
MKTLKRLQTKSRVVRDPQIGGGKPIIAGTRIPAHLILDHLVKGHLPEEIILEYFTLTQADIQAAMHFASAKEKKTHAI